MCDKLGLMSVVKTRKGTPSKKVGLRQDTKLSTRRKPEKTTMCNNDKTRPGENLAIGIKGKSGKEKKIFCSFVFPSLNYVRPDLHLCYGVGR